MHTFVHLKLQEPLGVVDDGFVDGRKVVEDEVLLDVADQLHQRFARSNLNFKPNKILI